MQFVSFPRAVRYFAAFAVFAALALLGPAAAAARRPSTAGHVRELARALDRVQIAAPVSYRGLSIYPVLLEGSDQLPGRWLTLDDAVAAGKLEVREKGASGTVPVVVVRNRTRDEHVFIMAGEVLTGGKQTRTIRHDVVVAPGQTIELKVFCVEARRWEGGKEFSAGKLLVPPSIQQSLRSGVDQREIWDEVARSNQALGAENPTGSLERAMRSPEVEPRLAEVRRRIAPEVPREAAGFIFVVRGRAVGAELFGRADLARKLLPKLIDAYAVDFIILGRDEPSGRRPDTDRAAIGFYERICRAGSERAATPGAGAGIRTRASGILGDGVGLGSNLVHYGAQPETRIIYPRSEGGR